MTGLAQTDCGNPCTSTRNNGCLFNLNCPRCGGEGAMHPEDAREPCTACKWTENEYPDDPPNPMGCPPPFVCNCRVRVAQDIEHEEARMRSQRRALDAEIARLQDIRRRIAR